MLRGGDGVSKHWTVCRQELDDVGWQTALPQHLVDGVAGGQGGVTGLPQHHVTLANRSLVINPDSYTE